MKYNKSLIILSVALCFLPCILGIILWEQIPDMMPTHFDLNNVPDQYNSKLFTIFGIPAIMALIDAVCLFGISSDPKKERQSETLRTILAFFVPLISCILLPVIIFYSLGKQIDIAMIVTIFIGLVLVIAGNYLPKCKQNFTMGIRLPWTLASEENWNYTHRLGGFCFVAGGIITLIGGFCGAPWLLFVVLFAVLITITLASYLYYRRHREK